MKSFHFYGLAIIGICLIIITSVMSYGIFELSTIIADRQQRAIAPTHNRSSQESSTIDYVYKLRAIPKRDFYKGDGYYRLPNHDLIVDLFGDDYVGTLFHDNDWVFVLVRKRVLDS